MTMTDDTVQVALRIRPLIDTEVNRGCETCLETVPDEPQVQVKGLAFTYNHVFPPEVTQAEFYDRSVKRLIDRLFKGYNVTILAYGQTGSGKTYSMGTCHSDSETTPDDVGVIPRAVADIFDFVDRNLQKYDFKVTVSFMELYQEHLYDLLSAKPRDQSTVDIREDNKGIILPGLTEQKVTNIRETMACLARGSEGRATGATAMNVKSSRSHAIFTINISQEDKADRNQSTTSKFHLVDLAGSERSKKTKATGNRFKEGVKINQGLLALGNVISTLGDGTGKGFVCYRDNKLTRLLQDSLGGNSVTLMIACVSPADYNLEETISTLRYADRARHIKNKPIVNQDAKSAEINRLNGVIQQLRLQILNDGKGVPRDLTALMKELEDEKIKNINLLEKYDEVVAKNKNLTNMLQKTLGEQTCMVEKAILAEASKEKVERKLTELLEECNRTIENLKDKTNTEAIDTINKIRSNITDLQSEQKHCSQIISNLIADDEAQCDTEDNHNHDADDDNLNESELGYKEEAYALDQVARSNELKDLVKSLTQKKHLAEKLTANNQYLITYNESVKESENRILVLEKEKEELMHQLKSIQLKPKGDPNTVNQHKTKIHTLENEIAELRKKCVQQANLIKMKERNDLKIQSLNNEIQQIKAAKVKLIKAMRAENDRFRAWKLQNEKKLVKLSNQDRKMQTAMVRMENKFVKQQYVLKRKMEDAVAANKRLKEALDRQNNSRKNKTLNSGKPEAVQQWIDEDIEFIGSLVTAEQTLKGLMEDRCTLTEQLDILKGDDPEDENIPLLQEDIQLRNAQIADLQQKILASDQENKIKTKLEGIQSMSEAKHALRYLFDIAAEAKREIFSHRFRDDRYKDLRESFRNATEKATALENKLQSLKGKQRKELLELERIQEEKVSTLIKQLNCMKNTNESLPRNDILERLEILQDAYERCRNSMTELLAENELLKKQKHVKKPKQPAKRRVLDETFIKTDLEDEYDSDDSGDEDFDPKNYDKMGVPKMKKNAKNKSSNETTIKRSSDSYTKCSCKAISCNTKICSCKKSGLVCGPHCRCDHEKCLNRTEAKNTTSDEDSSQTNKENVDDNETKSTNPDSNSDVDDFKRRKRPNKNDIGSKTLDGAKKRTFFYHDKEDISSQY